MIVIAPAEPAHSGALAGLAGLAGEMTMFYGAAHTEPPDVSVRLISESLFADPPSAYSLLA